MSLHMSEGKNNYDILMHECSDDIQELAVAHG